MKTKVVFWRYPRKISLLKDLREGYPRASLLRKSMKTGGDLGIPSKISLLKDLAWDTLQHVDGTRGLASRCPWGKLGLSKIRRSHCCYQTANVILDYLSHLEAL